MIGMARGSSWKQILIWAMVGGFLLFLLAFVSWGSSLLVEWLWMKQVGYVSVFWRLFWIAVVMFSVTFVVVFFCLWINLWLVISAPRVRGTDRRLTVYRGGDGEDQEDRDVPFQRRKEITRTPAKIIIITAVSFVVALVVASIFDNQWDTYIRYYWGGPFGSTEPVFDRDVGFYLFSLPFYELIQNTFAAISFLVLFLTILAYFGEGLLHEAVTDTRKMPFDSRAFNHVSALFAIFLAAWGWGYYLDLFGLLFSQRGIVYGAGYTDYYVVRISLWVMLVVTALLCGIVILNIYTRWRRTLVAGIVAYLLTAFIALFVVPGVVQRFTVAPNELALETPFLTNNIQLTRQAYDLDKISEYEYRTVSELTYRELAAKEDIVRNIRLWDWRPLLQTYQETQAIRLYYQFYEVDVDRYDLGDAGYRQVMLSARELVEQLPREASTWVNTHLQFTHGYGLAMNLASETAEEGLPVYVVQNLPPVSDSFTFKEAAIYYGEHMSGFRIVGTRIPEFDYPKGSQNVYVSYKGKGGVRLDSFWKRLLFAWYFFDINFLLSDYIGPESLVQFHRPLRERVNQISPFFVLDRDPYLVIDEGKLFWIQDVYTTASSYPYSSPAESGLNYIRNPVKVVVDAYDGAVSYYVINPADPIIQAYSRAFPNMFKPFSAMPAELRKHMRYPEDLFMVQTNKFRQYHMTVPQVFYNQEDLWAFPNAKYAGEAVQMTPYYILTRLPNEEKLQYILILPFTPANRENMIAWMAAKCDQPDYGKILLYSLPKQYLTYGPSQIEATIDQDDVISQQLTLWDQRGSRVIRGNLIVIPVDSSFLYVEPVFIVAEGINIPQLKRVIMVYGKRVVMAPTINEAIRALFADRQQRAQPAVAGPAGPEREISQSVREQIERAERALEQAREALRQALGQ